MNIIARAVVISALWCSGCASALAPTPDPPRVEAWPMSVADTCPQRTVPLCCFRTESIRAAMRGLTEQFRACHPLGGEPVKVMLTIETQGGSPTCVDRASQDSEAARCLAKTVARHLVIPNSDPDERCSFRYPVSFR